ncbi:ligT like Phosphoesterase family protein [Collimonas arenae]|uniref:2'-5' RNA ligase family protein n=1 Tax=Collimonas arenae TaxID=279058 RepID=UPI0007786028|nr:2'-5' RNA ligase family protein [Collimonas arenae]AMP00915.1 ligT like Phosphoesterase family protein [Collimonas arenae]
MPGFDAPPRPTDRLFFALIPAADAGTAIVRQGRLLREELGLTGRLIGVDRVHVTLSHLGDYLELPQDVVATAMSAAANVRAEPFDVVFERVVSFHGRPRNYPLVLVGGDGDSDSNATLTAFQRTLVKVLQKAGIRSANSHYTPHITLLYNKYRVPPRVVESIRWTVQEFALVHSLLGRSRHVTLARWPLQS